MSKKSYKRLQNRLYREIKRRIIAEHRLPVQVETFERPIQTFKTKYYINCRDVDSFLDPEGLNAIRTELAKRLGLELLAAGTIDFVTLDDGPSMLVPGPCVVVKASVDVVLPKTRT